MALLVAIWVRYGAQILIGVSIVASVIALRVGYNAFTEVHYQRGWDSRDADWKADTAKRDKLALAVEIENRETERRWSHELQVTQDQLAEATRVNQAEVNRVIADANAGTLKLRERFRACSSALSAATKTASGGDETREGGLRKQDEEFLIRIASEANQVVGTLTACQKILAGQ